MVDTTDYFILFDLDICRGPRPIEVQWRSPALNILPRVGPAQHDHPPYVVAVHFAGVAGIELFCLDRGMSSYGKISAMRDPFVLGASVSS
jgi:hypothetical protein